MIYICCNKVKMSPLSKVEMSQSPNWKRFWEIDYGVGNYERMRTAGNVDAPVMGHLSYNAVEVYQWDEDGAYQSVKLPDGTGGFVSTRYLRHLLDYRAIFYKQDGKWLMTGFLAGD